MPNESVYQQISNLIKKSHNILILTHAKADCDGLGAALSAYLAFKTLNKKVTVVTNDPAPENLQFLPSIDILSNSLSGRQDFIITVDSAKTGVEKIKYNVEGNKVNIIITPKNGTLSAEDISFGSDSVKYDLIIVFDTGNLEHLGSVYDKNVEMFYETPVINIDHHASNTDFGQVNLVDSTAASSTEVLYEYLAYLENQTGQKLITEDIATLLLAGIITDTGSFQHANTSPRAMETSAKLLDLGARQQEVIKNIYKTKKLSTLKLWGIILSKVQVDPIHRMVWSTLSKGDFQEAGAETDETEGIIDDLLTNAPGAEVIFLIKENPEYVSVSMRSTSNQIDVGKFCAENGGGGHIRAAGFKLRENRPFDQTVSDIIGRVQTFQARRLQLHPEDQSVKKEKDRPQENIQKPPQTSPKTGAAEPPRETYLDFNGPAEKEVAPKIIEDNPPAPNNSSEIQAPATETPEENNRPEAGEPTRDEKPLDFGITTEENVNPAPGEKQQKAEAYSETNIPQPDDSPTPKKRKRRRKRRPQSDLNSDGSKNQTNQNPPLPDFPTPPPIVQ